MSALAARLGDTLLARGWLDADQLDIAQAEVRAGRPLEQALAQLGFVPDGVLRDTLAELLGLDSLEARALVADSTALAVVPAHWARQLRVLPLRYAPANQTLTIASARPADLRAHDQLVAASQGQVARVHVQAFLARKREELLGRLGQRQHAVARWHALPGPAARQAP